MRGPWLVLVALAGLALGLPEVREGPARHAVSLTPQADIPVTLAAGPDGSTAISVNQSGAASLVQQSVCKECNTTTLSATSAAACRIRLTLVAATGLADCKECYLQLRQGATTSDQLTVDDGVVTQSQGALLSLAAEGAPGSAWYLWAHVKGKGAEDTTATLTYHLDIVPAGGLSPSVAYWNMTMQFRV